MSKAKKNALGHDPFAGLGDLNVWDDEPTSSSNENTAVLPPKLEPLQPEATDQPAPTTLSLASLLVEKESQSDGARLPLADMVEPELPEVEIIAEEDVVEAVAPEMSMLDLVAEPEALPPETSELDAEVPMVLDAPSYEAEMALPAVEEPLEFESLCVDDSIDDLPVADEEDLETAVSDLLLAESEPELPELDAIFEEDLVEPPNAPVAESGSDDDVDVTLPDWDLFAEALEQPLDANDAVLDAPIFENEAVDPFDDEMWLNLLQEAEEAEEEAQTADDLLFAFDEVVAAETPELDTATSVALEDALSVSEEPLEEVATETADPLLALVQRIDDDMAHTDGLASQVDDLLEPEEAVGQEVQHIVFELAEIRYAVPIQNVLEITQPQQVTAVPNVPDWLMGVTNLRGDILSLVNFRRFLNMPPSQFHRENQMLVIQDANTEIVTGLVVDRVLDMQRLVENQIGAVEVPLPAPVKPYASGVYDSDATMLVVLNVNSLLNSPAMRQFETVA